MIVKEVINKNVDEEGGATEPNESGEKEMVLRKRGMLARKMWVT